MALNSEYFDAINIDVVKKKYYNANKVNAVLEDIRAQAEQMYKENLEMKAQLESFISRKSEIGDAVLSAQSIYRDIIDKANARAAEIVADAEAQRTEMLEKLQIRQDYSVSRVENMLDKLRKQHMESIEAINAEWQDFLCGLYPEDEDEVEEEEKDDVPADLSEKVGLIAKEMFSIGEE